MDERRRAGTECSSSRRWPRRPGYPWRQLAVAWTLQNDNVATAIIGAREPEQVEDNATAVGVKLSADLLAKIDEILTRSSSATSAKTQESRRKPARRDRDRSAALTHLAASGASGCSHLDAPAERYSEDSLSVRLPRHAPPVLYFVGALQTDGVAVSRQLYAGR